jgi:hypothetical protein
MESESKTLKISGAAVDDYHKQIKGKKGGTRKQKKDGYQIMKGGGDADMATRQPAIQQSNTPSNTTPLTVSSGTAAVPNAEVAKVLPALQAQQQIPQTLTQNQKGGSKIILEPKKQKGSLLLAPPTKKKVKSHFNHSQTRKVKLTLSNMNKRLTTAKVIHKDSKEKSIEEIRKLLEEAKLVKPAKDGKKVPEDILRTIYKDYLILRNKAL